jgi:Protein of unknown function (DUF3822)
MVEQFISIYGDAAAQTPFNSDQLVVEISATHLVTWVKQAAGKEKVVAFEWFTFDATLHSWYDIFFTVRSMSKILDRGYIDTRVFFQFPETVLIPADKFSEEAAAIFVNAMHGDSVTDVIKTDLLQLPEPMYNAYKISKQLNDMVNGNMMMVSARHTHSTIVEYLLQPGKPMRSLVAKLQFYKRFFTLTIVQNNRLLLVQSYEFNSPEDVLYYLINATKQFNLVTDHMQVELSGAIDTKGWLFEHLKKVFTNIVFDKVPSTESLPAAFAEYPDYYFTPFFNVLP